MRHVNLAGKLHTRTASRSYRLSGGQPTCPVLLQYAKRSIADSQQAADPLCLHFFRSSSYCLLHPGEGDQGRGLVLLIGIGIGMGTGAGTAGSEVSQMSSGTSCASTLPIISSIFPRIRSDIGPRSAAGGKNRSRIPSTISAHVPLTIHKAPTTTVAPPTASTTRSDFLRQMADQ